MIITISGPPGSGKSTVAKAIADKLQYKRYYAGGMRREAAEKRGMTLEEFNRLAEADPSIDKELDDFVTKLGEQDDIVVESRTAFHFIPHSFKVFLDVSVDEATRRISSDPAERNELETHSFKEKRSRVAERRAADQRRYRQYYGFDYLDRSNYDVVIDTTHLPAESVVDEVLVAVKQQQSI